MSLFWAPKGLCQIPDFNLIGKSKMAFFNGPITVRTKILVQRWGTEKGFRHCFAGRIHQSKVLSVAQAI